MRTIPKRMPRWCARLAVRAPFAIVVAVIATVGTFAVEPAWATSWITHKNKKACIMLKGYESSWSTTDNQMDLSLWNTAAQSSNHERLLYKTIGNWSSNRDKWHCTDLSDFTTKPHPHVPLGESGTIYVNYSYDDPVHFNMHQSKKNYCMTVTRNNKGNSWTDTNCQDCWDISQTNQDASC